MKFKFDFLVSNIFSSFLTFFGICKNCTILTIFLLDAECIGKHLNFNGFFFQFQKNFKQVQNQKIFFRKSFKFYLKRKNNFVKNKNLLQN